MNLLKRALTYDDLLLVPLYSDVLPRDADLSTSLTGNITLNMPFLSAAMDRVTESRLAIILAQLGGMGVIHKNLTIEKQAVEVDRVKRSEAGMIVDPVTLSPDQTIGEAREVMKRYHISGVPITEDGRNDSLLVGILTNRDLRFEKDLSRRIRELMTSENLHTVPINTDMKTARDKFHQFKVEKLPVVDEHRRLQGLITIKDLEKASSYPKACKDKLGRLRVGAAVGVAPDAMKRAQALVSARVDVLFLESAHAHSEGVMRLAEQLRSQFPDTGLVVGNVATVEAVRAFRNLGADAVKVGIGAGSICTTRVVAGVGVPMMTAIDDCSTAAKELGIPTIADGGIRYSGDIFKALAIGANCVMMGNIFAGTDESPGELIPDQGAYFKEYRGMGSLAAMLEGSAERYFQDEPDEFDLDAQLKKLVPQGVEGRVAHRGPLSDMVHQLAGGVRAGMGYVGAGSISQLHEKAVFIEVSAAGVREGHVHDVFMTKEAPNYRRS